MLPEPHLLFRRFEMDAGTTSGARTNFQMFITDLIKIQYPLATAVEGPGGRDWGIDTFVGELNGQIFVWQSKFVLSWEDSGPQNQVRKSFNDVMDKAREKGHTVKVWTLCVPCNLHPEQQRWFTTWARKKKSECGTEVKMLNGTDLRHQLMREDARDIRREYFPDTIPTAGREIEPVPSAERIATITDRRQFDDALFVKQLHAAGHLETDAMRGLFFATEALFRDYTAKGDQRSLDAIQELHLDIQEVWEFAFNEGLAGADQDGRIKALLETVMERAAARPNPAHLILRPAHKKGAAHRLVEAASAGWVSHWRDIAADHTASSAERRGVEGGLVTVGAAGAPSNVADDANDSEGARADE